MNDRWRDTYDQWKLRSDRDEYPEDVESYDDPVRFQCNACGYWFPDDCDVLDCYNPDCPMMP